MFTSSLPILLLIALALQGGTCSARAALQGDIESRIGEFYKLPPEKQIKELKKTQDQLYLVEIILRSLDMDEFFIVRPVQDAALPKVTDPSLLARIAKAKCVNDGKDVYSSWEVRREAAGKIGDERLLIDLAEHASASSIRAYALSRIQDQAFLVQFANRPETDELRLAAIKGIKSREVRENLLLRPGEPEEGCSVPGMAEPTWKGRTLTQWVKQLKRLDREEMDPEKGMTRLREAGEALAGIGRDSLPALERLLDSNDLSIRYAAVYATSFYDPRLVQVVPGIVKALRACDEGSQKEARICYRILREAMESLIKYGREARDAVPACIRAMERREHMTVVLRLLAKVGPSAAPALDLLIKEIGKIQGLNDLKEQQWILEALGNIGPKAKTAMPLLEQRLKELKRSLEYSHTPTTANAYLERGKTNLLAGFYTEALYKIQER